MDQKPSVGCIVRYQSYGTPGGEYAPEPRAAIVTAVYEDQRVHVDLAIINPTGLFFTRDVEFSQEPKPGHWNWPPRMQH